MKHSTQRLVGLVFLAASFAVAPAALGAKKGAAPPDYGLDFVTIGAPGNRHMLPEERWYNVQFHPADTSQVGRVDYEYRIMKSVVRVEEWFEFVNVAWPIWEQDWGQWRHSSSFSSSHIRALTFNPDFGSPNWEIIPGREGQPVTMAWRVAALYCNWLHNGRPTGPNVDLDLLRSGAYDISTFTRNPDGTYNDQYTRSPGAKYWIPDLHEWTKAVYYDPDRYGEGKDGYWLFPYMFNDWPDQNPPDPSVYGDESPWGLRDVMSVVNEWTESLVNPFENEYGEVSSNGSRFARSSGDGQHWLVDVNDSFFYRGDALIGGQGLRIASLVPSPGAAALALFASFAGLRRERRRA